MIRINGEPVEPADGDVVETEQNLYSVLSNGESYEVRIEASEISVGGTRLEFEIDDPRQWKRSGRATGSEGHASITAAMPGKIVRVLVSAGDEVTPGQGILVIEAMKMQNELKSPREGRVADLRAVPGSAVASGEILAVIE